MASDGHLDRHSASKQQANDSSPVAAPASSGREYENNEHWGDTIMQAVIMNSTMAPHLFEALRRVLGDTRCTVAALTSSLDCLQLLNALVNVLKAPCVAVATKGSTTRVLIQFVKGDLDYMFNALRSSRAWRIDALIACEAIRCWCTFCKDVKAPFALRQEAAAALGDAAEVRSHHTNIECSTRRAPSSDALTPT